LLYVIANGANNKAFLISDYHHDPASSRRKGNETMTTLVLVSLVSEKLRICKRFSACSVK